LLISEKHIARLYQTEFIAFAFLLPIYRKVIPYVISVIVLTWLLEMDFGIKAKRLATSRHRQNTLLFAGIYVLYLLGLLYTVNYHYGLFDLEVKMSLIIFPVIMATVRDEVLTSAVARQVLWAFVYGVLASMLLCYSVAFTDYLESGSMMAFYYRRLSVLIHPSYLAMFVSFAIAILLYFLYKGVLTTKLRKILAVLLVFIFEFFVIMLSSKAGILSLAITLAIFTSYVIFEERRIVRGLVTGGLLAVSFVFLFMLFPASAERFAESQEIIERTDVNTSEIANSTGERILIWWYTFEITNENFLFGVGTGDVKDHLLEKYYEKEMDNALQLELNAHNQYLQILIAMGIIGMVVLLLNLVLPTLYSIEQKHFLYFIFLMLIGFNFLFESMLETQAGVVFYAFFNAYLFAIKKDPDSLETGSHELS
jgi:O-antigen ligase